ncbi:MAG: phosphate ABC transporter permease PstA [Chloroflexota bacterium]
MTPHTTPPFQKLGSYWDDQTLPNRHRQGKLWHVLFLAATAFGIFMLAILLADQINNSFGYAAFEAKVPPAAFTPNGENLEALDEAQLIAIINEKLTPNRVKTLEKAQPLEERAKEDLIDIVNAEIVKPTLKASWGLFASLFQKEAILAETAEKYPDAYIQFVSWLNADFVRTPQNSDPLYAGISTAIVGSLYVIVITILVAFPIGVSAAIYLQEYAEDSWFNRLIQTNINNLAGVPSVIYGMLGLAIFVRALSALTSGALTGYADADPDNGRTILSAGLTMALLILPVIIINAQEAIKAVPNSLREASFGLGATQWQTVWAHVLPNAIPGILTGTIISISRAFGETAPLIIVGASTYITFNPDGVFSRFTTLPIQIYQWTSRPQEAFHHIASAGILTLLALLLAINAFAIFLRNRYSRKL